LGQRVFDQDLLARIYPEARALVKEHQSRGDTVVIVSSATQFQVERIAQELGIEDVLCTQLEVHEGRLTGMLHGEACYGEGKVRQAKEFCRWHKTDLKHC